MPSSVVSIDDSLSTNSAHSYDSDEEYRLAQEEWEESLAQLSQLVSVVLLPFFGKWFGRKVSHLAYARYLRLGLGKAFLFGRA
ncbi:hypothetical protein CPB83DRAFT_775206 [Crepidotus variabilis]|uniref:Uncharacterized protein n=1 Tax=Crepidotus variabilis TaxID=179855 RepID=A0A9P6JK80_9AGAR|nr:hypothetical protein CPB83DRAFT_775206 [Crepidotus variabilis]